MYTSPFLKSCLALFLIGALPIYGYHPGTASAPQLSYKEQFYITGLWHDGGRYASFFLPYVSSDESTCRWIDTGMLIGGSHIGYRKVVQPKWTHAFCFTGIYLGYSGKESKLSIPFQSYPTRIEGGLEFNTARWGQLTVNVYGVLRASTIAVTPEIKDYYGVSGKFAFHHFPFPFLKSSRVKSFVGGACAWVGMPSAPLESTPLLSAIVGAKWIVNHWLDFELKWVYDVTDYQFPINFGFQIKWDGIDPCLNYARYKFRRPPDSYIPHYERSTYRSYFVGPPKSSSGNTQS